VQSRIIEVAGDESGFSGSNLVDPTTEVFTHATHQLSPEVAQYCVDAARAGSQYSVGEYKSNQLLRPEQRPLLEWLLGATGPLYGKAHVHLTDKPLFMANRLVELFLGESTYASMTSLDKDPQSSAIALMLHRQGPAEFGLDRWHGLLQTLIAVLRAKRRRQFDILVDRFFHQVDLLGSPSVPGEVVRRLSQARDRVDSLPARFRDDRVMPPPLEPLITAIIDAALHWGATGRSVVIDHDEQSALTRHRVAQINQLLLSHDRPPLTVRRVDSRTDPRIQVADLLAGAARRIVTAELDGQGDPGLTALIRPYLAPASIWADSRPTGNLGSQRAEETLA
jgi:hypothetical protein